MTPTALGEGIFLLVSQRSIIAQGARMMSGVTKEKGEALKARMALFGIREADIEERFVRSSKKGGQKANKTSSRVYLKHRPTGIEVKCQDERSQATNRFLARRILIRKIESSILGRESEEEKRIEKIRRQKRRRSRRAKEKMLRDKKLHSEKKGFRRAPVVE